jgi:hypothetical protein
MMMMGVRKVCEPSPEYRLSCTHYLYSSTPYIRTGVTCHTTQTSSTQFFSVNPMIDIAAATHKNTPSFFAMYVRTTGVLVLYSTSTILSFMYCSTTSYSVASTSSTVQREVYRGYNIITTL